jgi:hypothetical protein
MGFWQALSLHITLALNQLLGIGIIKLLLVENAG